MDGAETVVVSRIPCCFYWHHHVSLGADSLLNRKENAMIEEFCEDILLGAGEWMSDNPATVIVLLTAVGLSTCSFMCVYSISLLT